MRKIICVVFFIMMIISLFSGCNEQTKTNIEDNNSDKLNENEEKFFNISGNITNNYLENIEIDYAIITNNSQWDYWAPTIEFNQLVSKEYNCEIKGGYKLYYFWVQIFFEDGSSGYFLKNFSFSNSQNNDLTYFIEITHNGEIEIYSNYSSVSKLRAFDVIVSADTQTGDAPLQVSFSYDCENSNGDIISHQWDFGNGDTSDEMNPTYTFDDVGEYDVYLTITDKNGVTSSDSIQIETRIPPPIVVDYTSYDYTINVNRHLDIVGIVKNTAPVCISNIDIKATLYDAAGNIIDTNRKSWDGFDYDYDLVHPDIIRPNDVGCFEINFNGLDYFDNYDLEIVSYKTSSEGYKSEDFEFTVDDIYSDSCYEIWGETKNIGSNIYESVDVYCIFYNSEGDIIDVGSDILGTIYSGQEELTVLGAYNCNPNEVSDYELKFEYKK